MCNIMGAIGRVVCLTTVLSAPLYAPSDKGKRAQEFKGELKGRIDPSPFRGADDEPFYAEIKHLVPKDNKVVIHERLPSKESKEERLETENHLIGFFMIG